MQVRERGELIRKVCCVQTDAEGMKETTWAVVGLVYI